MRFQNTILIGALLSAVLSQTATADDATPRFSRHAVALFSRLGCNSGNCHGAVQGKNGFRLSLFGADPARDHQQIVRAAAGRRVNLLAAEESLLLLKATAKVPHGGGRRIKRGSADYELLRRWIAGGAGLDATDESQVTAMRVTPSEKVGNSGESYALKVEATFADGSTEEVTSLCSFSSTDEAVAAVDGQGKVTLQAVGDAAVIVRYRSEPVMSMVVVPRGGPSVFDRKGSVAQQAKPHNFIDEHVLAKLRRLNVSPSPLADDATFLRRARLDVTGQLPKPEEVRAFLADDDPQKRAKKIDQLLAEPGYAALWALKFCDILGASDFGVYADGLAEHFEAPRFHAWVRARMKENTPYDQFAARILTATSRDGRDLKTWGKEVVALQDGYTTPRKDLELYAKRKTLDAYWQRKGAIGVAGTLQVAHAFLGLRLECAQCHRHPHDVWQQDDLLSFANFFMRVRKVGFQGQNEKKLPLQAKLFKQYTEDGKKLVEEAKKLKEGRGKQLAEQARKAQGDVNRLKSEISRAEQQATQAEGQAKARRMQAATLAKDKAAEVDRLTKEAAQLEKKAKGQRDEVSSKRKQIEPLEKLLAEDEALQKEIRDKERRGKSLSGDIAKRILHSEVFHRTDKESAGQFASVTNPLGTQSSKQFRLLGESQTLEIAAGDDPREKVVEWMRRPDNPFFAKAIVNRVWAHYFGRGIVDPPDDLSPLNPPTHPKLLDEMCRRFIEGGYDLKWLHRTILTSRTYQQSSMASGDNQFDRANYAYFYFRRHGAEVVLDALNQATGTRENMDMKYYHWPESMRTVEIPYVPRNAFVKFMLEQFGRPQRNSSVQCDCERQGDASMLQVISFANHPRVWQKIADANGRVAAVMKETDDVKERIELLYLGSLSRRPSEAERVACEKYIGQAESPDKGLQGVLWSLLNTKEFILQH
jgi:hypothetical protein